MKCKRLLKYEVIGVFLIFILGCLWHFIYDMSGENYILGLFAPVNESMWEHWKIGMYPILIYSAFEYIFVKEEAKNFLFSKFISIIVFEIVCFSLTGLWHAFFKDATSTANLIVDIGGYFVGVLAGQIISYIIACNSKENKKLIYIALAGIILHIIIFIIFTIKPPMNDYFKDNNTGEYGIYKIKD
ncbi:DUF6512 family protein [Clostridium nigeriense]|uniref:DUF6512 family protein n=1 Tax=Clostridium nigeriense TaxID=1805470 RepID=UPI0008296A43|nr:DUF6512 family protein [Clostridium nigeriense]